MRNPPLAIGPTAAALALLLAGCVVPPAHTTLEQFDHGSQFVQTSSLSSQSTFGHSPHAQSSFGHDSFGHDSFGHGPTSFQAAPYGYDQGYHGGYKTPYLNHQPGPYATVNHVTYGAPYPNYDSYYGSGYYGSGYPYYGALGGAPLAGGPHAQGTPGVTLSSSPY